LTGRCCPSSGSADPRENLLHLRLPPPNLGVHGPTVTAATGRGRGSTWGSVVPRPPPPRSSVQRRSGGVSGSSGGGGERGGRGRTPPTPQWHVGDPISAYNGPWNSGVWHDAARGRGSATAALWAGAAEIVVAGGRGGWRRGGRGGREHAPSPPPPPPRAATDAQHARLHRRRDAHGGGAGENVALKGRVQGLRGI
jgi:hypothetical protein